MSLVGKLAAACATAAALPFIMLAFALAGGQNSMRRSLLDPCSGATTDLAPVGAGPRQDVPRLAHYTPRDVARLWVARGGPTGDVTGDGVDEPTTAGAVAMAESGGDPEIVNGIGATGLMQIHPGGDQYKDPIVNMDAALAKFRAEQAHPVDPVSKGWRPWEAYTGPDGVGSDGQWREKLTEEDFNAGGPAVQECVLAGGAGGDVQIIPGHRGRVDPKTGDAMAPASAPPAVRQIMEYANRINDRPYSQSPPHQVSETLRGWYDCSSSTAYALLGAGLVTPEVNYVSGTLAGMYQPGPGEWVTIYANAGHVWMIVAGLRWDTSHYGATPGVPGSGPRWSEFLGRPTSGFAVRHPPGL